MTSIAVDAELPDILARADNLPSPPAVALEVLRLTGDDGVGIEELVHVISRDPALTAKLLRLSNSSMYRRGEEVTTLEWATMVLGLKTVKLMALSFSLANSLPNHGARSGGFDHRVYWTHSLTTAVAARSLCLLVRNPLFDEAFMCGLLMRLGQLVMAECLPERYEEVCDRCAGGLPLADVERAVFGFDFHHVGAALLESWEMPRLIHQTIRCAGDLEGAAAGADLDFTALMRMADDAATVICDSRKGPALKQLEDLAKSRFDLSEEQLEAFVLGLRAGIREASDVLNINLAEQAPYEQLIEQARSQIVQISLGTAMDLRQTTHRAEQLERDKARLKKAANTDKLTGISNRACFDETLRAVVADHVSGEARDGLGLIVLDIDHFKAFNDTHGHAVGDDVLRAVAQSLEKAVRASDHAARYGGEEFVVILPACTAATLAEVAERIREQVEALTVATDAGPLAVTTSVGGAWCRDVERFEDGRQLLKLADQCLYEAKQAGRNRSVTTSVERVRHP